MLCRVCHRLVHPTEWEVRLRDGLPEFIPPAGSTPSEDPADDPCPTWRQQSERSR